MIHKCPHPSCPVLVHIHAPACAHSRRGIPNDGIDQKAQIRESVVTNIGTKETKAIPGMAGTMKGQLKGTYDECVFILEFLIHRGILDAKGINWTAKNVKLRSSDEEKKKTQDKWQN